MGSARFARAVTAVHGAVNAMIFEVLMGMRSCMK